MFCDNCLLSGIYPRVKSEAHETVGAPDTSHPSPAPPPTSPLLLFPSPLAELYMAKETNTHIDCDLLRKNSVTATIYSPTQPSLKTVMRMMKMRTQTTWPMSIYLLYWMDRPPQTLGRQSQGKEPCPYCTLCVCLFIFQEKKEVYIQFSLLDVYLYCFVFYNLYIYNVRLTIYHDILYYHSFSRHFVDFTFFFNMKKYICPKRNSVIYLSCYHVSISPLPAVNCIPPSCKNPLLSVKSLSQMFMSHIRKMHVLGCVFIYQENINHFMYRSASGLFTTHDN